MPIIKDRVKQTTTSTGTGAVSLSGTVTGFQTFAAALTTGASVYYCIADGTSWEIGSGTYTAGSPGSLSRDSVLASSNAGSLVSWGVGTKDVFVTVPAAALALASGSTIQVAAGTSSAPGLAVGEANSGFYRVAANVIAFVVGAAEVFRAAASGIITFAKAVRGAVVSISYAATVTPDFSQGNDFTIGALTGNLTIANPSNVAVGQSGAIYTTQDATGGRTISFGSNWKKVGAASATTTASKVNAIAYSVPSSTSEILYSIVPQP